MRLTHPPLLLLISIIVITIVLLTTHTPSRARLSAWSPNSPFESALRGEMTSQGLAATFVPQSPPADPFTEVRRVVGTGALPVGTPALEAYNQASVLVDATPDQHIRYYTRRLEGGGHIAYFVVRLSDRVRVQVLTADGALPGSTAEGDTAWADGQRHLATVAEMANAPYAAREQMTLMAAMAVDYHGNLRTSPEGTTVMDGTVYHVNPGRAALCIGADGAAAIGLFDREMLQHCDQAVGGGPVVLWRGKIANPDVAAETEQFVPYNPLDEDFVEIDWHRTAYQGRYPKSQVCLGLHEDGSFYLVMLVAYGAIGMDVVSQLKAMGCIDAMGGDEDTSTQAVWRGAPVQPRQVQEVPNALAVYYRGNP